jgi:predicted dehydrogenase
LALDLGAAEELVAAVDAAEVPTQMVLTWRYADPVRRFLEQVAQRSPLGGRGCFLTGGLLGGMFATPWRLEHGPLPDLGPHVVDLLDAALGPVVDVRAHGQRCRWIGLELEHASGVVSQASLTAYSALRPERAGAEIYDADGVVEVDTTQVVDQPTLDRIADEFVAVAAGTGRPTTGGPTTGGPMARHPLDVHRGLHLQRVLAAASAQLD